MTSIATLIGNYSRLKLTNACFFKTVIQGSDPTPIKINFVSNHLEVELDPANDAEHFFTCRDRSRSREREYRGREEDRKYYEDRYRERERREGDRDRER